MKKLALITGYAFVALSLVYSCRSTYTSEQKPPTLKGYKPNLVNGKKLAITSCGVCHIDPSTGKFTGAQMRDAPKVVGTLYAANITQDSVYGIANSYTDGELRYLMRTGIKKDGTMAPFMVRPNMSDKDMEDIIAYLRSDDELVQPGDTTIPQTKYSLVGKMVIQGAKPLSYPNSLIPQADPTDLKGYGKYLIDNLACFHCHSAAMGRVDDVHIEQTKGFMAGGAAVLGIDGKKLYTSNLTFDKASGIGNWSLADFEKAVRHGVGKGNKILRYPMKMYPQLTKTDVEAMYTYLESLEPVYKRKLAKKD